MRAFFDRSLSSDLLADALALYRNNPGLVDTPDAVARRMGVSLRALAPELGAMKRVGLLKEERVGAFDVLFFDVAADASLAGFVGDALSKKPPKRGAKR